MAQLSGNDVNVYLWVTTGTPAYKAVVCATDATLSNTAEVIQSKTKCGTKTKSGTKSWEISFSGLIETAPGGTEVSFDDIWDIFAANTRSQWAFQDAAATNIGFEGFGLITKLDVTAQTDNDVEFSMTITGDGDLAKI